MRALATLTLAAALGASCKSSIDFDVGRPYACGLDAGEAQCAPGWRCGLSGRCHAVGDAQEWACLSNADCEGGWVCGLEGTCHDPAVPAAYQCLSNEQCVAPWQCGFAGRCLDARVEAVPFATGAVGAGTVLQPRFFSGEPDVRVGVIETWDSVAIARGSAVRLIGPGFVLEMDAGTPVDAVLPSLFGDVVFFTDAGVTQLNERGPGNTSAPTQGPFRPIALIGPRALDGDQLKAVGGFVDTIPSSAFSVAQSGFCLISANSSGLYAQADTAIFPMAGFTQVPHPISLPTLENSECTTTSSSYADVLLRTGGKVRRLLAFTRDQQRRTRSPTLPDGGAPRLRQYAVYDTTRLTSDPGSRLPDGGATVCVPTTNEFTCGDPRLDPVVTSCNLPCDSNEEVADLRPTDTGIEFECAAPDGTLTTYFKPFDGTCDSRRLFGRSRFTETRTLAPARLTPGRYLATGAHGQVWWGPSLDTASAMFTDEPPLAAMRGTDGGTRWLGRRYDAELLPALGLRATDTQERVAAVRGRDDLLVTRAANVMRLNPDGGANLRVTSLDTRFDENEVALAALAPDTDTLFVASGDSLFIGTRAEWEPSLPLKVVPAPGLKLTSLVPQRGGTRAWVSTSRTVFELTESNSSWTEKAVPLPAGELLEVWTDSGERSRVAYVDGRVLTLPNGVPLVRANTNGAPVRDVLAVCDQLWGIVGASLAHVVGDHWESVAVTVPRSERVIDPSLAGGRLFLVNGKIVIFNGAGSALEFAPTPACP